MNQENNNYENNEPKMIGFDPITGQPIFDKGLGSVVEKKEENRIEKKVKSKGKFIFHIFLSFLLWNFIMSFVLGILNNVFYEMFKNSAVIYLSIFNLIWIGATILEIFLTYWFNKFNTALEYQLRSIKNINLIMFFILIIFINSDTLGTLFNHYPIIEGVFIVIHMIAIWFVNEKMFDKYWGSDHF